FPRQGLSLAARVILCETRDTVSGPKLEAPPPGSPIPHPRKSSAVADPVVADSAAPPLSWSALIIGHVKETQVSLGHEDRRSLLHHEVKCENKSVNSQGPLSERGQQVKDGCPNLAEEPWVTVQVPLKAAYLLSISVALHFDLISPDIDHVQRQLGFSLYT
ncbi:hypothetical protein STEG23_032440, partial [Scotinomys teguina]